MPEANQANESQWQYAAAFALSMTLPAELQTRCKRKRALNGLYIAIARGCKLESLKPLRYNSALFCFWPAILVLVKKLFFNPPPPLKSL